MKFFLGLGLIGGAVWLSRSPGSLRGLGDLVPPDARGEALDEVERAARSLYSVVDGLDPDEPHLFYADDEYRPNCEGFGAAAEDALSNALRAQKEGLKGELSVRVAATQAWALSQAECGSGVAWAERAVEWPEGA